MLAIGVNLREEVPIFVDGEPLSLDVADVQPQPVQKVERVRLNSLLHLGFRPERKPSLHSKGF